MPVRKILLTTVAATMLLPALPAMAQNEGDIIVTARKREESIMKVPVIATAIGQAQLQKYAIGNLEGISDRVPGLKIGSAIGSFGSQVSLRGVGTAVLNATIDQSVSLNVDGMQMTQGLAYASAMFDMAGVQVLKGPQALFYGKASPAGVISIRTADPTDKFDAILRGGYESEAKEKTAELIVSGPVSDTLKLRLAAKYSNSDGFFKNAAVAAPGFGGVTPTYKDGPNNETWLLRGTALWAPTDRFDARLKVNYSKSDTQGSGGEGQYVSCPDGTASVTHIPFLGGEDCVLDETYRIVYMDPAAFPGIKNGGVPFGASEQTFGTLELNYDIGQGLKLTSVTGGYDADQSVMINGTQSTSAGTTIALETDFTRTDFTQEVRLTSDFADSPVNFTLGGFYQDASMYFSTDLLTNRALPLPLPPKLQSGYHDIDIEAVSAFGQVLWDITPNLELGAGTRWTEEERTDRQTNLITGTPVVTPLAHPRIGSSKLSPEFTLTYRPTDDLTFFGSVKQAFKSGSFTPSLVAPGSDTSFGDERVRGGEAGVKARFFDRNLVMNLAAYDYEFKGLQVGANETNAGVIAIRTLNAASAKVYGVDFDATYTPPEVEGLTLRGGVNWNHARYDAFKNAPCWGGQRIQDGCNQLLNPATGRYSAQDLSGKRLMRAPDWSVDFGVDYEKPIFNDMKLSVGASTNYSSSYYTNILLRDDMLQDSYFKTNASVAVKGPNDGWELALIGNNLGNEIVTGNCPNGGFQDGVILPTIVTGAAFRGPGGVEELSCHADRGREVWVRFTLRPFELFNKK